MFGLPKISQCSGCEMLRYFKFLNRGEFNWQNPKLLNLAKTQEEATPKSMKF